MGQHVKRLQVRAKAQKRAAVVRNLLIVLALAGAVAVGYLRTPEEIRSAGTADREPAAAAPELTAFTGASAQVEYELYAPRLSPLGRPFSLHDPAIVASLTGRVTSESGAPWSVAWDGDPNRPDRRPDGPPAGRPDSGAEGVRDLVGGDGDRNGAQDGDSRLPDEVVRPSSQVPESLRGQYESAARLIEEGDRLFRGWRNLHDVGERNQRLRTAQQRFESAREILTELAAQAPNNAAIEHALGVALRGRYYCLRSRTS